MTNGVGPFDGGFSAKFVIHDQMRLFKNVVDSFKSVVAVSAALRTGEVYIQLISTEYPAWFDPLLSTKRFQRILLPLYIFGAEDHPPPDSAPPKSVG